MAQSSEKRSADVMKEALERGSALEAIAAMDEVAVNPPNVPGFDFLGCETPLHVAVRAGHLGAVRALLEKGADPNRPTPSTQYTPVHLAAGRPDSVWILDALFAAGGDVTQLAYHGITPLHCAVRSGGLMVNYVLSEAAAPVLNPEAPLDVLEVPDMHGSTALSYAARFADLDTVLDLIRRGADIQSADDNGDTPLHIAAHYDRPDTVTLLLEHDADPSAKNKNGETALHVAAHKEAYMAVARIVKYGGERVDVDARDDFGMTPLHRCAAHHQSFYGASSYAACALLDGGADISVCDHYGDTPLHVAARYGYCDMADLLLGRGARSDVMNERGFLPLHSAVYFGRIEMIQRMLQRDDVDVDAPDAHGDTSLHIAAVNSCWHSVSTLIAAHANVHAENGHGYTPLHIAQRLGRHDIILALTAAAEKEKSE